MRGPTDGSAADAVVLEALAEALPAPDLSAPRRRCLRDRVLAAVREAAPALTETVRGAPLRWQEAWQGVWLKVLRRDLARDLQVTLLRLSPGGRIPEHAHVKEEECVVLEGEVLIGTHRLQQGDFHLAQAGARHPDITSPSGALLLVRSEIPRLAYAT